MAKDKESKRGDVEITEISTPAGSLQIIIETEDGEEEIVDPAQLGVEVVPLDLAFIKERKMIRAVFLVMNSRQEVKQYLAANKIDGDAVLGIRLNPSPFADTIRVRLMDTSVSEDFADVLAEIYAAAFYDRPEVSLETEALTTIIGNLRKDKQFRAEYKALFALIRRCAKRNARRVANLRSKVRGK